MTALKHLSDGLSSWRLWLGMALAVSCLVAVNMVWPSAASAAPATTTTATESCQPTDGNPTGECEPRTDDGAVEWHAYDDTPKCVAQFAIATAAGGGAGGLPGAAWGGAASIGYCWVDSW